MKEKVEKLSKVLAKFADGTKNMDELTGVQRIYYDRAGLGFNKNPRNFFQKLNKNMKAKRKCSTVTNWVGKIGKPNSNQIENVY